MRLFVLSFFPRDVLEEIWDLIESVSEVFPTYSFMAIQGPSSQSRCKLTPDVCPSQNCHKLLIGVRNRGLSKTYS